MSRRVEKKASHWNSGNWVLDSDLCFVYDDWNVVLVLDHRDGNDSGSDPDNTTVGKYTWGLDLSGQRGNPTASGIHGSGGVGGLLSVEETADTSHSSPKHWFLYDANGNVSDIVQNTTGYPLVAHYEFDPYGNTIVAANVDSSGYVDKNPFRFSTKWLDSETSLYNYGRRFDIPRLGRWLNRDPKQESGGINLYTVFKNAPAFHFDPRGDKCCIWIDIDGTLDEPFAWPRNRNGPKLKDFCDRCKGCSIRSFGDEQHCSARVLTAGDPDRAPATACLGKPEGCRLLNPFASKKEQAECKLKIVASHTECDRNVYIDDNTELHPPGEGDSGYTGDRRFNPEDWCNGVKDCCGPTD